MGPWETVLKLNPEDGSTGSFRRDGKQRTATLQHAAGPGPATHGSTRVTLVCTVRYPEWELRLAAIDHDGKEHVSSLGSRGEIYMASFNSLLLSSIKELHLQLRPYNWVENLECLAAGRAEDKGRGCAAGILTARSWTRACAARNISWR